MKSEILMLNDLELSSDITGGWGKKHHHHHHKSNIKITKITNKTTHNTSVTNTAGGVFQSAMGTGVNTQIGLSLAVQAIINAPVTITL
jgi:hypothetical protein